MGASALATRVFALVWGMSACAGQSDGSPADPLPDPVPAVAPGPVAHQPPEPSRPTSTSQPSAPTTLNVLRQRCVARDGDVEHEQDLDGDGQPDMRQIFRDGRIYCRQMDLNFDGVADVIRFYDDQGNTTREAMDLDFDGQIDMASTDDNAATGMDTDFDGQPDTWEIQLAPGLVERRRDTDGDGRVDHWERERHRQLIWVSVDQDQDGAPDTPPPPL